MKTIKILGASILALSAVVAAPAMAQSSQGYWKDTNANIWKDPYGLCWRAGYWTPAMAITECDPDLVPKPAPAPAPVAPPAAPRATPAPTPAPVVVAPPPPPKRCDASVTLMADELFAFNKATLKPTAMAKLDKDVLFVTQLCAPLDRIMVTGHTDRIGSQQYNQKLSERRANAVKAYLVKKGIPAAKIETMGMGKTLSIKSCPDGKNRKALIECLTPNRRATVEISGLAKK